MVHGQKNFELYFYDILLLGILETKCPL